MNDSTRSLHDPLALGPPLSSTASLPGTNPEHTQVRNQNITATPAVAEQPTITPASTAITTSFSPPPAQHQATKMSSSDSDETGSSSATLNGARQSSDEAPKTTEKTLLEKRFTPFPSDDSPEARVSKLRGQPVPGSALNEKTGLHEQNQTQTQPKTANQPPVARSTSAYVTPATGATGGETLSTYGMSPVQRHRSLPPAVGLFGGVAPSGDDADSGLRAVRSHEEEIERQAERDAKGPDSWAVKFDPGEKANPKNWGVGYRWFLTSIAGLLVLNSTFASSSPSGIVTDMVTYFHFSLEVGILTIALFVAGYCVGPILWGPLSESYGRRPIFIITFIFYVGFQVGCALSRNTASILVFRFLGGTFAAAPLTNSGGVLADIWDTDHRGQAMSLFALAPFAGPSIGPIVSGFISVSGTDWRWVYWILAIFAGVCLGIIIFFMPETYAPILLVAKAKRLRKETGDDRWYAPLERKDNHFKARMYDILCKPFVMLALEPMLLAITMYMSFVYGVVYLLFEAYPFVFERIHGFNAGENGLAFLGFFLGGLTCVIFFMTVIEPRYQRYAAACAPEPPEPEKRLELCVISGWCLVIALFWFGWTAYASIHWISPVLAGGLIGVGVLGMFVSLFNFAVDTYLWAAASALAAMTVMRSFFGAGFPLFASQMYEKLGVHWASSLLGFLALVMAPIPMILMKYGAALRKRSKFSPNKM